MKKLLVTYIIWGVYFLTQSDLLAQYPKLGVHGQGQHPASLIARFDMTMEPGMSGDRAQLLKTLNPAIICLHWKGAYDCPLPTIVARDLRKWVVSTVPTTLTDSIGTDTVIELSVADASVFFNPFYFCVDTLRQFCMIGNEFPCQVISVNSQQNKVLVRRADTLTVPHSIGEEVRGCASSWPGIATMNISPVCPYGYWNGDTTWADHQISIIRDYVLADDRLDGILIDQLGAKVSDQGQRFDYQFDLNFDGINDSIIVDSLWKEGAWHILRELRALFPGKILLTEHETWAYDYGDGRTFNGWPWLQTDGGVMSEPGNWISNMQCYAKWNAVSSHSLIHGGHSVADSNNFDYMRFTLASCLMGDGYCAFDAGDEFGLWWFDEYSVDSLGQATNDDTCKGWLGDSLCSAYAVSSDLLVWRRDFEHGTAIVSYLPPKESLWVDLNREYAFIKGVRDTIHNTGDTLDGIWMRPREDWQGHGEILFKVKNIGIEEHQNIYSCALYQNSPNPFTQKTVIEFKIVGGQYIEPLLQIYDLAGRVVKNFLIPNPQSQITKVVWNGKDDKNKLLPSGMYFMKLKVGEFSQSKKLLLLR